MTAGIDALVCASQCVRISSLKCSRLWNRKSVDSCRVALGSYPGVCLRSESADLHRKQAIAGVQQLRHTAAHLVGSRMAIFRTGPVASQSGPSELEHEDLRELQVLRPSRRFAKLGGFGKDFFRLPVESRSISKRLRHNVLVATEPSVRVETQRVRLKGGQIVAEFRSANEKISLTLEFNVIFAGRSSIGVGISIGFAGFLVGHFADSCGVGARPFRDHRHFGVDLSAVQLPGPLHVYRHNSFCR